MSSSETGQKHNQQIMNESTACRFSKSFHIFLFDQTKLISNLN